MVAWTDAGIYFVGTLGLWFKLAGGWNMLELEESEVKTEKEPMFMFIHFSMFIHVRALSSSFIHDHPFPNAIVVANSNIYMFTGR